MERGRWKHTWHLHEQDLIVGESKLNHELRTAKVDGLGLIEEVNELV